MSQNRRTLSTEEIELRAELTKRYPILRYFRFAQLPEGPLRETSARFTDLAFQSAAEGEGAEVSAGLRKLLEAKDCLVRSVLPPE